MSARLNEHEKEEIYKALFNRFKKSHNFPFFSELSKPPKEKEHKASRWKRVIRRWESKHKVT